MDEFKPMIKYSQRHNESSHERHQVMNDPDMKQRIRKRAKLTGKLKTSSVKVVKLINSNEK